MFVVVIDWLVGGRLFAVLCHGCEFVHRCWSNANGALELSELPLQQTTTNQHRPTRTDNHHVTCKQANTHAGRHTTNQPTTNHQTRQGEPTNQPTNGRLERQERSFVCWRRRRRLRLLRVVGCCGRVRIPWREVALLVVVVVVVVRGHHTPHHRPPTLSVFYRFFLSSTYIGKLCFITGFHAAVGSPSLTFENAVELSERDEVNRQSNSTTNQSSKLVPITLPF